MPCLPLSSIIIQQFSHDVLPYQLVWLHDGKYIRLLSPTASDPNFQVHQSVKRPLQPGQVWVVLELPYKEHVTLGQSRAVWGMVPLVADADA